MRNCQDARWQSNVKDPEEQKNLIEAERNNMYPGGFRIIWKASWSPAKNEPVNRAGRGTFGIMKHDRWYKR